MHKEDEHVQCPYYKNDEPQIIRCEGVENGTALHLAFSTRTQHKEYKKQFCRSCWGKCMIARILNAKWGCDDGE
jgi:hypothetical protein